jgi:hypothetical protein
MPVQNREALVQHEEITWPAGYVQIVEDGIRGFPGCANATEEVTRILAIDGMNLQMEFATEKTQSVPEIRRPTQPDAGPPVAADRKRFFEHFFQFEQVGDASLALSDLIDNRVNAFELSQ